MDKRAQDGRDTSGMKMTDSIVVRLGLALGVSGLLIVYAMSSSLKGISVFRSDVSRILEQNQLLVLSDQKVIAFGLLEEMALRNLLLNPEDSVAARNLHKFEKMSLGMLSQGKSETYTLKDPVSRARILRDLDALETKFKDHLATISLILSILPSDRTKALRLMKVREVSEWRKIRRDIQALISISQHDVAVKQEQLSEKYHRIMLESISTAAFGIAFSILALGLVYLRFRKGSGKLFLSPRNWQIVICPFLPKISIPMSLEKSSMPSMERLFDFGTLSDRSSRLRKNHRPFARPFQGVRSDGREFAGNPSSDGQCGACG